MKLLYAEDEVSMSEAVVDILTYHKYTVDAVYDGEEALEYAQLEHYDGIILDIMMPKKSGLEVLKELRANGDNTPVLLLTAKTEIEDRIEGLDLGADDYLPKPFAMGELLARIRAMLRRKDTFTPNTLTMGNVSLNMATYELSCGSESVTLPKLEYQLMELFMRNPEKIFSTEDLMEKLWGWDSEAEINVVWTNIANLRRKLEKLSAGVSLRSIRGVGYELEETKC